MADSTATLGSEKRKRVRRPARRALSLRMLVLLALLLVILLAITARVVQILTAVNHLNQELAAFTSLDASQANPDALSGDAGQLIADIRAVRMELGWLPNLGPLFFWVPRYGNDLAAAPTFVALLDDVTEAADATLTIYAHFNAPNLLSSTSPGEAILSVVNDNQAALDRARVALTLAQSERAKIDSATLSPTLKRQIARLDTILPTWRALLELAQYAPVLFGKTRPRAYLVLAQNPDELRATGGYISSVGLIRFEDGNLTSVELRDSYAADDLALVHPPPPHALAKYMYAPQWLIRDSNWYPDFPTTAQLAMSMYNFDQRVETDGVIAIDLRLIPDLLAAVGTIQIADTGEIVTPGTVIAQMQTHWAPPPDTPLTEAQWEHRKDFVSQVMTEMVARIKTGQFERGKFVRALWNGFTEKHLMVYFNEPPIENALAQAGWSGSVFTPATASLAVIDSNVGFNKVNANITQLITYTIDVGAEWDHVRAQATYTNNSPTENAPCDQQPRYGPDYGSLTRGCYYDVVRIVVPAGTKFLAARNVDDAGMGEDFAGVSSLQGYFILKPQTTTTVEFEFDMPTAQHGGYNLILQKQAGVVAFPIHLQINFPTNLSARGSNLTPTLTASHRMDFDLQLDQDVALTIDVGEPVPQWIYVLGLAGAGVMIVGLVFLRWGKA